MDVKNMFSKPASSIRGWLAGKTAFIATKLTYLLAIGFLVIAVYHLAKSLNLL